MSRVAIFEGLGRRRRRSTRRRGHRRTHRKLHGLGKMPKARPGHHWHQNKNRKRGRTTAARRLFASAASKCKVVFKGRGTPIQLRRKFNACIKQYMLAH